MCARGGQAGHHIAAPPPRALPPSPSLGSSPRDTHLVGEVEAVMGASQLQRPGVSLLPLQATVHADLPRHMDVRGLGGMGGGGAGSQYHSPCRRRSAHPEGVQGPGTPAGSPHRSRRCPEPGLGRGCWGEGVLPGGAQLLGPGSQHTPGLVRFGGLQVLGSGGLSIPGTAEWGFPKKRPSPDPAQQLVAWVPTPLRQPFMPGATTQCALWCSSLHGCPGDSQVAVS